MVHSMEEIFGSMVFNDYVMQSRLPKTVYKALKRTMELGKGLDPSIADLSLIHICLPCSERFFFRLNLNNQ